MKKQLGRFVLLAVLAPALVAPSCRASLWCADGNPIVAVLGTLSSGFFAEDHDQDGAVCALDCDDFNAPLSRQVWVGAPEICDGLDSDCSSTAYPPPTPDDEVDGDADGYVPCAGDGLLYPPLSEQEVVGVGDCDESRLDFNYDSIPDGEQRHPGRAEVCDGLDNDCVGTSFHPAELLDPDGDGMPHCPGCDDEDDDTLCYDCDDSDPSIHMGAAELCDMLDNDCDPETWFDPFEYSDQDLDGVPYCDDCEDLIPSVYPGAPAETCDGFDTDCDPATTNYNDSLDLDGDGWASCVDCDDSNPTIYPGAEEACDGVDSDCDRIVEVDNDGDSYLSCVDCDDSRSLVYPGAVEFCNGIDDDCSGGPDPDDADRDGVHCGDDCDDDNPATGPGFTETCDGLDNNCDGQLMFSEVDSDGDGWLLCCSAPYHPDYPVPEGILGGCDQDDGDSSIQAGTDSDGDGLSDDFELDVYHTNPDLADSDGDGLSDYVEVHGDGFIDLPSLGADPNRKDLFLELDYVPYWTEGFVLPRNQPAPPEVKTKRFVPGIPPDALAMLVDAFADAPVTNIDGSSGIALHIIATESDAITTPGADYLCGEAVSGDDTYPPLLELNELRSIWGNPYMARYSRYAIWTRQYCDGDRVPTGSSGVHPGDTDMFIVALGQKIDSRAWRPDLSSGSAKATWELAAAGTIMHEFGHALGLTHHGVVPDNSMNDNYGENFSDFAARNLSIMSYTYQFSGVWRNGGAILDYSRWNVDGIQEDAIDEFAGLVFRDPDTGELAPAAVLDSYEMRTPDWNLYDESTATRNWGCWTGARATAPVPAPVPLLSLLACRRTSTGTATV